MYARAMLDVRATRGGLSADSCRLLPVDLANPPKVKKRKAPAALEAARAARAKARETPVETPAAEEPKEKKKKTGFWAGVDRTIFGDDDEEEEPDEDEEGDDDEEDEDE